MRILLVTHYSLPHVGGIEVLVDTMGQAFAGRRHEVTIVSSRSSAPAREDRGAVKMIRVPALNFLERWLHVPYPLFAPSLVPLLRHEIRRADVVHVHGVLYLSSLCSLFWAWWMGRPLVLTEHVGFVPYRNPLLNAVQRVALSVAARLFLRRADAVITYNASVRGWMEGLAPCPERLYFVPNGVDTERFRPVASREEQREARRRLGIESDGSIVLFVGRFVEKKGLDTLLQAAGGGFDLVLCGSGRLPPMGRERPIRVLCDVVHDGMPDVYRAADVFVLPSKGEGFPVAIMEAMACGLPVVAVRDPSYDDYVTEAEMIQTEADPTRLRAELERLLGSEDDVRRRRMAARRRALDDFSLDNCAKRHLAIYEQVRRGRARAARRCRD